MCAKFGRDQPSAMSRTMTLKWGMTQYKPWIKVHECEIEHFYEENYFFFNFVMHVVIYCRYLPSSFQVPEQLKINFGTTPGQLKHNLYEAKVNIGRYSTLKFYNTPIILEERMKKVSNVSATVDSSIHTVPVATKMTKAKMPKKFHRDRNAES